MGQRYPQACALSILVQLLWVNLLLASEECESHQNVWSLDIAFATITVEYVGMRGIYQTGNPCCKFSWNFVWSCLCFGLNVSKSQGASTKKASMLLKDELQRRRYIEQLDLIYEVRKVLSQSF